MKVYLLLVAMVSVSVLADYFLKFAALRENSLATWQFYVGTAIYASTAVGWVYAMKYMPLASIGVAYSVVTILFLAALGTFVFREAFGLRDAAGIALAVAALALMNRG